MSAATMIGQGVVKPDGTLELPRKLDFPAGPIQVTVGSITGPTQSERFWTMMESLWADPRTSGRTPRTHEGIDAEIDSQRIEAEEEIQAVERLQEECRRTREQARGQEERPR